MSWYTSYRGLGPTILLEVSEYGVARGAGGIVGDVQFDVEAEICVGLLA